MSEALLPSAEHYSSTAAKVTDAWAERPVGYGAYAAEHDPARYGYQEKNRRCIPIDANRV